MKSVQSVEQPLFDSGEHHRRRLRISQYIANMGSTDFCRDKCPKKNSEYAPERERRCCEGCANAKGYFGWDSKDEVLKLQQTHGWNDKTGFWTTQGCRLPREQRSDVCVGYYCGDITKILPLVFFKLGTPNKNRWHHHMLIDSNDRIRHVER